MINTVNATTSNIIARPIIVTAVTDSKTYDGTTSSAVTPIISENGYSPAIVGTDAPSFIQTYDTKNVGIGKTLTPSGTVADGNSGNNYSYTFTQVTTGTITKKPINVTAQPDTKTYDGSNSSSVIPSADALATGDSTTTPPIQTFADKNVGTGKTLTPSVLGINDGNGGGNYNVTYVTNSAGEIDKINLTVTGITTDSKTYDRTTGATLGGSATLVGVISGDTVTISTSSAIATFDTKDVRTGKTVTVTGVTIGGTDAGNYLLTQPTLTDGVITQKSLTVTATGVNKVYDNTTAATVNFSAPDEISGDSLTLGYSSAIFADKTVGTGKTVSVSGISLSAGNDAGNYSLQNTTATASANITAAPLTALITVDNKVYDGNTSATITGYTLSGRLGTDDVAPTGGMATFADANVGAGKTVTATGVSLGGADKDNYKITGDVTGTADITPLAINVTPTAGQAKVYGNTDPVFAYTSDLLMGTDGFSGALSRVSDENVGNYDYTLGDLSAGGNYTLSLVSNPATFEITPRTLNVSSACVNKVYDGTTGATVTLSSDKLNSDAVDLAYTTATFSGKTVDTGKPVSVSGISISGTSAGNYTLGNTTAATTADITPVTLTADVVVENKNYDGTPMATIDLRILKGVISINNVADDVTPTGGTATFSDKNVGTDKPVSATGITITGTDAANYLYDGTATGKADIAPLAITITADPKNKGIGQDDPALTYKITSGSLVAGDSITGALTRDAGEGYGQYAIEQGTLTAGSNYNITYVPAKLSINDITPPTVVSNVPSQNAVNISPTAPITVTFSEPVNMDTSDVSFSPTISGGVTIANSGTSVVTITPTNPLADNTTYTVTLTTGVTDIAGNHLANSYSGIKFTTETAYSIPLNANASGWNLISLPVVPSDNHIASVLGSAESKVNSVWTYDPTDPNAVSGWLVFSPSSPASVSNLNLMTTGFGYWVSVSGDTNISGLGTLLVAGPTAPPSRSLEAGWNLIGYYQLPNESNSTAGDAFKSLGSSAYTGLWGFDNTTGSFKSVTTINPGDAFWISLPGAKIYTPSNI